MSLKGDKYENAEEVRFRLESTVVTYEKKPVLITQVRLPEAEDRKEIARVFFRYLPTNGREELVRKYLSSKHFDLAPFPMGYCNHNGSAFFISRNPIRQNRQGLCTGNTIFTDVLGRKTDKFDFAQMVSSTGFVDMFNNKYPSFKEAGELLDGKETSSVAVGRSFAFLIDADIEDKLPRCAQATMRLA